MSIRNFPKIPKIILRKSADQAKGAKNKNYEVAILICAGCLYFYVALPLKNDAGTPAIGRGDLAKPPGFLFGKSSNNFQKHFLRKIRKFSK